mmetsp:Transcript_8105/g.22618  ORF Transcript_8105/g.22618 Transcript_8105/m.22618 type:complete len:134 (+) Transcript_8105:85-486(+)
MSSESRETIPSCQATNCSSEPDTDTTPMCCPKSAFAHVISAADQLRLHPPMSSTFIVESIPSICQANLERQFLRVKPPTAAVRAQINADATPTCMCRQISDCICSYFVQYIRPITPEPSCIFPIIEKLSHRDI